MKIEIGSCYKNKTWKYFIPCVNYYGQHFVQWFNTTFKLAVGIGDTNHDCDKPCLYILYDNKYQPRNFGRFINWLRYQPYFVCDYMFEANLKEARQHMVVLEIPEIYHSAYENMIDSRYSKMYTKQQVHGLFHPKATNIIGVLTKSAVGYNSFINNLNEQFGSEVTKEDFNPDEIEFDTPFNFEEEMFNYKIKKDDSRNIRKAREW